MAWLRQTRHMRRDSVTYLERHTAVAANGRRILAVISPWQGSAVPWYTLALALLLSVRGHRVDFVLDDCAFGDKPWRYAFVLRCLRRVLRGLAGRFDVTKLSAYRRPAARAGVAPTPVVDLARMNTTWQFRGEMVEAGREAYINLCVRQISRADQPIADLLVERRPEVLLVPGGVFGTSGLWVAHARALGVRVCTFDSGGYGVAMFATNGVACHLQDIPEAFRRLKSTGSQAEHAFAHAAATAEMARRREGVDAFESQVSGAGSGDSRYDGAVLIALNSSWDAAALGLHTIFPDNMTWIVETVRLLLAHTGANVIVRQHPVERLPIGWTSDDYGALLHAHFGDEPRLHFIAAADHVNSYALLARVCAVVTYTSTIGIEAAALGKPVISPSRAYYAGLGFVAQARDLSDYQALLEAGAAGRLQVSPQLRADALLCYYLTQCCNWFFSPFNPADYSDWSRIGLEGLHRDGKVAIALTALADGTPLALLNHQTMFAAAQAQPQMPAVADAPASVQT